MAKKEKNCDPTDPADDRKGDCWDYVALDPEHRLVVSAVPGERTAENAQAVVNDFKRRTGGRVMNPTATATPGRLGRPTGSRKIGVIMRR